MTIDVEEYPGDRAFIEGCALLPEPQTAARIFISGGDAEDYLQRMLSCDLRKVTAAAGRRGTLMTAKGKLISFFDIHRFEERFFIVCDDVSGRLLQEVLDRFIILEDVEIHPSLYSTVSIQGPQAKDLLPGGLETLGWQLEIPGNYLEQATISSSGNAAGVVVQNPRSPAGGWDLHLDAADASRFVDTLTALGAVLASDEAVERARICLGIPRFGNEVSEKRMPPECALDDAISYDKGCYAGQEVMARIRTYGHVNRLLRQVKLGGDSVPVAGAEVKLASDPSRARIGVVTSSALDLASGEGRALASIAYRSADPGTEVVISSEDKAISGALCLPFLP